MEGEKIPEASTGDPTKSQIRQNDKLLRSAVVNLFSNKSMDEYLLRQVHRIHSCYRRRFSENCYEVVPEITVFESVVSLSVCARPKSWNMLLRHSFPRTEVPGNGTNRLRLPSDACQQGGMANEPAGVRLYLVPSSIGRSIASAWPLKRLEWEDAILYF